MNVDQPDRLTSIARWERGNGYPLAFATVIIFVVVTRFLVDPNSYFDAEDALNYANVVRSGDFYDLDRTGSGWHLLYYALDQWFDQPSSKTLAGELISRIAGTVAIPILFLIIHFATGRPAWAAGWSIFFGAMFAPWWYSLQADKYVPQLAVQACALLFSIHLVPSRSWLMRIGYCITCALAVTVHSTAGLVGLAAIPHLLQIRHLSGWGGVVKAALGMGIAFALPLVAYFAFLQFTIVHPTSLHESWLWVQAYTAESASERPWGHWRASAPFLAVIGIARAILSVDFIFGVPGLDTRLANLFPTKILVEEHYIAGMFSHTELWIAVALLIIFAVVLIAMFLFPLFHRSALHRLDARSRTAMACLLCYLVPAILFFSWWEPENNEFWISPLFAITAVIGIQFQSLAEMRTIRVLGVSAVVLLLAINGIFGIFPRTKPDADPWLTIESATAKAMTADDIAIEYPYVAGNVLNYLLPAGSVIRLDKFCDAPEGTMIQEMLAEISRNQAGFVYMGPALQKISEQKLVLRNTESACDRRAVELYKIFAESGLLESVHPGDVARISKSVVIGVVARGTRRP